MEDICFQPCGLQPSTRDSVLFGVPGEVAKRRVSKTTEIGQ